ncbi:class I SAM-dependent DNA methyltransferase [Chloroflexota bacterium]
MEKDERLERVQWIYSSSDNAELAERYDQWAKDYDSDLDEAFGWVGPQRAVDFLIKYVPKESRVLDAGAGTGLVGKLLAERGFKDIVAMDLSKGMLEEAAKKDAYSEFNQMVMGEHLDFPSDSFDAMISVGVMTVGHAPASSLDELVRVTKPGGYLVYSLRPDVYRDNGFKEKQDTLEADGKWKFVEVSEEFPSLPKGEPDVNHQVWVYQVS